MTERQFINPLRDPAASGTPTSRAAADGEHIPVGAAATGGTPPAAGHVGDVPGRPGSDVSAGR